MNNAEDLIKFFREIAKEEARKAVGLGVIVGVVKNPFPDIKIMIHESIELIKEDLYFSAHIMKDYWRNFEIIEGKDEQLKSELNIDTKDGSFSGVSKNSSTSIKALTTATIGLSPVGVIEITDPSHKHNIDNFSTKNNLFTAKGCIRWVDSLRAEDKVLILPTADSKKFYVIDKVLEYR